MEKLVKTYSSKIGFLRLLGLLEGISYLLLLGVAVPVKYMIDSPGLVRAIGPIHGLLFTAFVAYTLYLHFSEDWRFFKSTIKILISSFIPFGTFYIDHTMLKDYNKANM